MTTPVGNRIRFNNEVSLGHLLSMVAFLVTALTQWNIMDKRVVVLEEFRSSQRERDASQDNVNKEKLQEVKEALTDLKRSVEKFGDKLDNQK